MACVNFDICRTSHWTKYWPNISDFDIIVVVKNYKVIRKVFSV